MSTGSSGGSPLVPPHCLGPGAAEAVGRPLLTCSVALVLLWAPGMGCWTLGLWGVTAVGHEQCAGVSTCEFPREGGPAAPPGQPGVVTPSCPWVDIRGPHCGPVHVLPWGAARAAVSRGCAQSRAQDCVHSSPRSRRGPHPPPAPVKPSGWWAQTPAHVDSWGFFAECVCPFLGALSGGWRPP